MMAAKPKPASSSVIRLFDRGLEIDPADEVSVGRSLLPEPGPAAVAQQPGVDLSGRARVLFVVGAGNTGKTTLLRYVGETAMQHGSELILAAVDPENRSLKDYFSGVEEPSSYDPPAVAAWLEWFLGNLMESGRTAAIDFGGGDTSLGQVIAGAPDLMHMMEDAGSTPVAIHVLSPRVDDLSPLATLERAGFQPPATAIILNEGLADPTMPRERAFSATLRHSVFKAALARGAIQLWMPRLIPARDVEVRRVLFSEARDGIEPEGRRVSSLGPFQRARIRLWLDRMAVEFDPIRSWLP